MDVSHNGKVIARPVYRMLLDHDLRDICNDIYNMFYFETAFKSQETEVKP